MSSTWCFYLRDHQLMENCFHCLEQIAGLSSCCQANSYSSLKTPTTSYHLWEFFFFLLYLFINSCENLLLILVLSLQFKHFSEFTHHILIEWASPVAAVQEIWVRSLGQEDAPGEGNGYPLQFSFLENSMDRGAWRAIVHGVAKSWSVLSD